MSNDDAEREHKGIVKHLKKPSEEIENESLEDIFPNLQERPKEIIEKENTDKQTIEEFFPVLKAKIKHPEEIRKLIRQRGISSEEIRRVKKYFIQQLKSSHENVRLRAWDLMYFVTSINLISSEEIRRVKKYFLDLLKSNDELIRVNSWWIVDYLLEKKIVSNKEVKNLIVYLFELSKSGDYWGVVSRANTTQLTLVDKVITEEEYHSYSEKAYNELLESRKAHRKD